MTIPAVIMIVVAYLSGSICSAILICRLLKLPDPRTEGSNNPGATNVYRIGGKFPAILVLLFDTLKGTIPVWGAYFMGIEPLALGLIAVAACVGHIFPIFFGFKGGKGVATALGAILPIGANLVAMSVSTWLVVLYFSGYSSLAAVVTAFAAPIYTFWVKPIYTIPVAMLSLLILARHKDNIIRLYNGDEPKIGAKRIKRQNKGFKDL